MAGAKRRKSGTDRPTSVVTGGVGFPGSYLVELLLERDHQVVAIDNLVTGNVDNVAHLAGHRNLRFLHQDVTEFLFLDGPVNYVWHFASPASPIDYLELPIQTLKVGSLGTHKALGLAKNKKARFLLASTSEIYGDPLVHPQTEDYWGNVNPIGPRSCYDESKRLGETLTMEYFRQYHLNARIVRIFNTYGPNSQINDGRMIPNFITQALRKEPLTIYGDGSITRSICYVSDLVNGLIRAMFKPSTAGEVFNLGNTEEHTVLEYAHTIIHLCEATSTIVFEPNRVDDPERRRPNISKAQRVLEWTPKISTESGLRRTIEWFSNTLSQP